MDTFEQGLLDENQLKAALELKSGKILCSEVGTGKSRTALAWYYLLEGGSVDFLRSLDNDDVIKPKRPLYIITTARKRDTLDWEGEMIPFLFSAEKIDSWNNIQKYKEVKGAVFIFDEQRASGSGPWAKSFIQIARNNDWIMLSATPGDNWLDYAPVLIANGFFKNYTEFKREHVQYAPGMYLKYPKIEGYKNEARLWKMRKYLLVDMDGFERHTTRHIIPLHVNYDVDKYRQLIKTRWDPWKNEPITDAAALCYALRRCVNEDESRQFMALEFADEHPKLIIFYNFDYELEILRTIFQGTTIGEWNGHRHDPVPDTDEWVYLVNYMAGSEGWNCIETNAILFYSQNYSYKTLEQAMGRIDRRNTPFKDLYYYRLYSRSGIDLAINKAIETKKLFNENDWFGKGQYGEVKL